MATIFRGFSTVDNIRAPYSLYDDDLVKRDLLNEFEEINIKVNFYGDLKKGLIRYLRLVYFSYKICQKLKPKRKLN